MRLMERKFIADPLLFFNLLSKKFFTNKSFIIISFFLVLELIYCDNTLLENEGITSLKVEKYKFLKTNTDQEYPMSLENINNYGVNNMNNKFNLTIENKSENATILVLNNEKKLEVIALSKELNEKLIFSDNVTDQNLFRADNSTYIKLIELMRNISFISNVNFTKLYDSYNAEETTSLLNIELIFIKLKSILNENFINNKNEGKLAYLYLVKNYDLKELLIDISEQEDSIIRSKIYDIIIYGILLLFTR